MSRTINMIVDWTEEVNSVGVESKQGVLDLMKRFDFESADQKEDKVKHYPLSYTCSGSPEEVAIALEQIASCCWSALLKELQGVVVENCNHLPLKAYNYGEVTNQKLSIKLGKVYMCPPNSFSHVDTVLDEVKLFAFGYQLKDSYEVSGEINFGIEVY
jgi:hypothetical protein